MLDWKVTTALVLLGLAILVGLVICIVSSVNKYAKRFVFEPEDKRRGFDVKPAGPPPSGPTPAAGDEDADVRPRNV